MARVRLISGGPRSDRAAQIDALVLDRLEDSLLIVPTGAYARCRVAALLTQSGRAALLDPPVITFGELVDRILRGSQARARRIDPLEQRILLARAAEQAREKGALDALGDAAESEGFLDQLHSVILQLKQAAIEPKQFRQRVRGRRNAMDAIVAEVYAAYQDELQRAGAVDLPGMYWLARIECEPAARPQGLGRVRHIALEDFDDFTPSEFGVIKALARHLDDLVFGINLSADPEQQSLYAAPRQTITKLRAEFESATFDDPRAEPAPRRQSEFIGASLLLRKSLPAPAGLDRNVEFVECHTLEHEIETIARRIKHMVRHDDTALPRIAVVWRNTAAVAAPMREIFSEFGIPVSGLESRALTESAAAGFILRFLEAAQTWSPESVLDVLTAPWFGGATPTHADAFPILVRAARVRLAERGWRDSVDRLARYLAGPKHSDLNRLLDHVPHALDACAALRTAIDRFGNEARAMSRPMPLSKRIELLQQHIEQWHLADTVAAMPGGTQRDFEEAALTSLTNTLGVLRAGHDADTQPATLESFTKTLRRAFAESTASVQRDAGGVACLGMEPARYLSFDVVFLAGLTDGHVPARRTLSAIYSDDDRHDLGAAGIALDRTEAHSQHEILLFQRMFAIARRRLIASWHRLSPGGQEVQRSLYLNEIADRLGGLNELKAEAPAHALVPEPGFAACTRDVQNIAVPAGDSSLFPEIAAAAQIEKRRYSGEKFDAHDGALASPDALSRLAETYGPEHQFSASQLETYAECPFRFFQERVLELFAIDPPQQAFDTLARGSVLHGALERFHRAYLGKLLAEIPPDEAAAAMERCAGEAFDQAAARLRGLAPGVLAAERTRTLSTLQRHLRLAREAESESAESWRPARLEEAFGGDSPLPPYALEFEGQSISLRGKIDRIDEGAGAVRLIDYKSSAVEPASIKKGKIFQLALYALACEATILPGTPCAEAWYVGIGNDNAATAALSRTKKNAAWDERIALARAAVAAAVSGIRAGRFHPARESTPCRGCPDQKVCRFERARIHRKPAP